MNARNFISFFKTKSGMLILFLTGLLAALGAVSGYNSLKTGGDPAGKRGTQATAPLSRVQPDPLETESYTLRRSYAPAAALDNAAAQRESIARQARERAGQNPPPGGKAKQAPAPPPPLQFLPLRSVETPPAATPAAVSASEQKTGFGPKDAFAPYGRLLRAKLVTTVDSSNLATPVVGLVTHGLHWNNRLLIPANSEIHAVAIADRVRNRIGVSGKWVVILAPGGAWPSGSELILEGLALDMDVEPEEDRFGLTDGSAGLRGGILTNESTFDTVKLFAATFLAGATEGLTERRGNAFGTTQIIPSLESGALQGTREVMEKYAERILELIERDGAYVRVPAGKQFYLYIRETLQLSKAAPGATLAENALSGPAGPALSTARADWEEGKQAEIDARREAVMRQMAEQAQRLQEMQPQQHQQHTQPRAEGIRPPAPPAAKPSRRKP